MSEIDIQRQADIGRIASNAFGEHYFFAVNRNLFQGTDASTVFRSYFNDNLFKKDTFYIIAGTDSGLLYQYVKTQGTPKGSRYLFVELPEILTLLENMDDPQEELAVTTWENWQQQAAEMEFTKFAALSRLTLIRSLGVVHGHYSYYLPFWTQFKDEFDASFRSIKIALQTRPFTIAQIENLAENQIPAICLKDTFKGKTAVVLAGGPSLGELFPWVREHRRNLLVIAVSRISHSLIKAGIQPDISVSVDPLAVNLNVCKDMLEFEDGTLLVNNFHLSPNLLASWGGQKVFIGPRYPWSTPLQPENIQSSGGSTVTNSAFDLAVKTGATQIILGGVDFCFDQHGHTHAIGTPEHSMGSMPQRFNRQVECNNGMMADSATVYLEAGENIDAQAKNAIELGCRAINPAPGSMRLPHVEHLALNNIEIEPMEQPARETIARNVPPTDKSTRTQLYKEELNEVDRVLKELRAIKEMSRKALSYNRKLLPKKKGGDSSYAAKKTDTVTMNKVDHIDKQLNAKYADTTELINRYGKTRFIPLLGLDIKEFEELVENSQVYFQAMVETSDELTNILHLARARTLTRLEEDKPKPNVELLLKQWRHDTHPGRAIQWAQRHAEYVNQLPESQQQDLHAFEDTFDGVVEELGKDFFKEIDQDRKLDGTASKAKEYFRCLDLNGLLRLLKCLETHHDQKEAWGFTLLVQGYIAELRNDSGLAIESYQKVADGPVYLDVLMRLFAIHSKAEDFVSALEVLKTLSGINSTFSPMYADLLQASADIDTAVEVYTEYLLENPDDLDAMMKLGKLFLECGSAEGVEWTMSYILGKDPDNHTAQGMLDEIRHSMEAGTT